MQEFVREHYGKILASTADLKTSACCTVDATPQYVRDALAQIHPEVNDRYYGCGLGLPEALEGCRILDLGCGAGRDCFVLSKLVGPAGAVVGVDMTAEQLAVAQRHREYHASQFGYAAPNVNFHLGYIECLNDLPLEAESFDLIVSNCVINLSPDKPAVLEGAYRLLKPGGELYFAVVYADRRVPAAVAEDPVLYGECLGGALYWNDFQNLAKQAGFLDPRLVADRTIEITELVARTAVADVHFFSATYRLFKLPDLEPACEDYAQHVVYRGTVPHHRDNFTLDKHHVIPTGTEFRVCGNTFEMLNRSRFRAHFDCVGDKSQHFGIFPGCGTSIPYDADGAVGGGGCC
jgi:SAM-dependent methyltransferase